MGDSVAGTNALRGDVLPRWESRWEVSMRLERPTPAETTNSEISTAEASVSDAEAVTKEQPGLWTICSHPRSRLDSMQNHDPVRGHSESQPAVLRGKGQAKVPNAVATIERRVAVEDFPPPLVAEAGHVEREVLERSIAERCHDEERLTPMPP